MVTCVNIYTIQNMFVKHSLHGFIIIDSYDESGQSKSKVPMLFVKDEKLERSEVILYEQIYM